MGVKWIGYRRGAEGLPGWPAKDMSDDELDRRGLDKKALIKSGLYEDDSPKRSKEAIKDARDNDS